VLEYSCFTPGILRCMLKPQVKQICIAGASILLELSSKGSVNVGDVFEETMVPDSITHQVASLQHLSRLALGSLWRELFKKEPPRQMRNDLMLRIVAYRLQEQQFGGLSDASCRRLRQFASALEANPNAALSPKPAIRPGTRLLRQWKEQVHVVEVEAEGYEYKGARYESLSEIARLITGTRWSGPLFFGLKGKPSAESKGAR
jgi:hypothetical protein